MRRLMVILGIVPLLFIGMAFATPLLGGIASAAPIKIAADSIGDACNGIGLAGGSCTGGGAQTQVSTVLQTVVNYFSLAIGITAVIMIIISGAKFVTSSGDPSKISGARSTLMYAVIGIAVAALAQFIVHFVLANV